MFFCALAYVSEKKLGLCGDIERKKTGKGKCAESEREDIERGRCENANMIYCPKFQESKKMRDKTRFMCKLS